MASELVIVWLTLILVHQSRVWKQETKNRLLLMPTVFLSFLQTTFRQGKDPWPISRNRRKATKGSRLKRMIVIATNKEGGSHQRTIAHSLSQNLTLQVPFSIAGIIRLTD